MYEYTECDEIADNMPKPTRCMSFDEAIAIVNKKMPDEAMTIRMNVAEALVYRSRIPEGRK